MDNIKHFFVYPTTPLQKQYEAIQAIVMDKQPTQSVAKNFGYSVNTLYSIMRDVRSGKLCLFPQASPSGPKQRRTQNDYLHQFDRFICIICLLR
jgi:hypothetical protein